jgi:hypothetical protein
LNGEAQRGAGIASGASSREVKQAEPASEQEVPGEGEIDARAKALIILERIRGGKEHTAQAGHYRGHEGTRSRPGVSRGNLGKAPTADG